MEATALDRVAYDLAELQGAVNGEYERRTRRAWSSHLGDGRKHSLQASWPDANPPYRHCPKTMATQREVIGLVASECNSFAEQFFAANCHRFSDLEGPDVAKTEQKAEWFDVFKRFEAEAELTMQNALFLWGLVQAKTFQEEFVEEATQCAVLDDFLSLTDYPAFVKRMYREIQQKREQDAKLAEDKPRLRKRQDSLRPDTPMGNLETQQKLSELDQRLAALEAERNSLLVERRKLVGREVHATTSQTLKHQIELQRYKEDVGLD